MEKKEVELSSGDVETTTQHISQPQKRKGGLVTMPFIIANEALAKVATIGLLPNMILYLMGNYKLHLATATTILFLSVATSNFTPVVGAFIADSCLGRFLAVGLGSFITLLGMVLLWLTAMIPHAQPPPCSHATEICISATTGQMAMLLSSLALMSIGNGGLSCSLPFGADQVDRKNNPNNQRVLEMFFSWYYASSAISVIIAFTGIVYIQDHFGWKLGFGVPTALMFLSTLFFFLASPLYVKHKAHGSLLIGFAQVTVVAYKNRKLSLPPKNSVGMYHHENDSDLVVPTDKLRFLNKACVIRDPEKDIASDGSASNPWSLCTIEQVEELKAIIKVIPLWSTGIMMSVNIGGSFGLLQAKSMNRHITSRFEVPAGSFIVIMIITIFIWIALYDRVILPLASKLRGKPARISAKTRMGIGLLFSFLHLVTAAIVENIRRRRAISEGYINNTSAVLNMSAMWLFPQLCLAGIAEAFNAIGQNEFYYTEFPKTMSSIASSLFGLGMAAGNVISSMIFNIVENVTSSGGKEGWISDNIDKGHFDRYYWLLAKLSAVNILYYLACSWAYGPTADQVSKITEENGLNEDELTEFRNRDQFDKVSQETIPVQQMMDGTPQHVHGSSLFPLNSLTENPEPPRSWSQLLFSGLPGKKRLGFSHFQYKKLENWDDHFLNPSSTVPAIDVVEQEVSQSANLDVSGHEEFEPSGPGSSWSHMEPVSSPRSSVTGLISKEDHRKNQLGDHTYKVRKEKLDDRMTALHQLVCPFGKTDTASVLLETIGYIRFLHSQIEALSYPPYSDNIPKRMRNQLSVHGEVFPEDPSQDAKEKAKDLRSRGLALVPVSCIQHVRDVKMDEIARH